MAVTDYKNPGIYPPGVDAAGDFPGVGENAIDREPYQTQVYTLADQSATETAGVFFSDKPGLFAVTVRGTSFNKTFFVSFDGAAVTLAGHVDADISVTSIAGNLGVLVASDEVGFNNRSTTTLTIWVTRISPILPVL